MGLDSHVTLAVVFSFISMIGVIVSIYATMHTRSRESTEKEVDMTKNFTRLEVKLDSFNQRIDNINRNVEKSDAKLDEISDRLSRTDERINTLFKYSDDFRQRLNKLEGK